MNGAGDAHATALQHQHHVQAAARVQQQQQGMSLPMATTSFAAEQPTPSSNSNKPRLPGLPPTPPQRAADVGMDVDPAAPGMMMPPRKAHRRSSSDVPFGYFVPGTMGMGGGQQLPPPKMEQAGWGGGGHGDADDLFSSYLNLDGMDGLNNNNSSDERHEDGDSRGSSMKTNGADSSENESEEGAGDDSRAAGIRIWADRQQEGLKRGAAGEPPMVRHARSLSMDSLLGNGKINFNFPAGGSANCVSIMPGPNRFNLEFGTGEFTPAEMKKIMADDKLVEMALVDPKRVKRVLANRQSAARSKERKMRYIAELEQKVQILQTEATTLSAQLTLLQRDSAGIATENNELKFRLQAMEQQAQLRDALNEALTTELQRLKLATAELGDSCSADNIAQQMQLNVQDQMLQLQQQQQATPVPFYQLQETQQSEEAKNHQSKE